MNHSSIPEDMPLNSSQNRQMDLPGIDSELTRRELLRKAALAGALVPFPWADTAEAGIPQLPSVPFKKNKTGDGCAGPYGEARVFDFKGQALPLFVSATGGAAVMDISGRSAFIRFGTAADESAITLSTRRSRGGSARFGSGRDN